MGPSVLATFLKIPALLQGSIWSPLRGTPAEPCGGCPGGPAARRDVSSRHRAKQSTDRSYWGCRASGWRSQHLPAPRPWAVPVRSLLLASRRRSLLQTISLLRGPAEARQLPLLNDQRVMEAVPSVCSSSSCRRGCGQSPGARGRRGEEAAASPSQRLEMLRSERLKIHRNFKVSD